MNEGARRGEALAGPRDPASLRNVAPRHELRRPAVDRTVRTARRRADMTTVLLTQAVGRRYGQTVCQSRTNMRRQPPLLDAVLSEELGRKAFSAGEDFRVRDVGGVRP